LDVFGDAFVKKPKNAIFQISGLINSIGYNAKRSKFRFFTNESLVALAKSGGEIPTADRNDEIKPTVSRLRGKFKIIPKLNPRLCRGEWKKLCCSI
jgi:hypothetical protein